MPTYRYTADDYEGRRTSGHLDAATVEEARRQLEEQGLRVVEVMEAAQTAYERPPERPLKPDEAQQF